MAETVIENDDGAILYDTAIINQISPAQFSGEGWPHAEAVGGRLRSAGRGNTMFVGNRPRQFVLRHYVRGGLVGRAVDDQYLFTGRDATRSFREWRMLAKMVSHGLRVPRPAAARFVRQGLTYRADLLTVSVPGITPLSAWIAERDIDPEFWGRIGREIAEFHDRGVLHADMNAYNLQIDEDGDLWMLDFDKGRIAHPGRWRAQTLSRLHRSLDKVAGLDKAVKFSQKDWDALMAGYFRQAGSGQSLSA